MTTKGESESETVTVYVAPYTSNRECYHTDPGCRWVDDTYQESTEDRAKNRGGLRKCQYCAGTRTYGQKQDRSWYEWALNNE